MRRTTRSAAALLPALALFMLPAFTGTMQCETVPRRLRSIERRCDAVVLVADVRTGHIVAAARPGEAHEARYHPGSLFKIAIAVAALRSGGFDRSYSYTCSGKDTIAGVARRCWNHRGHATIGFSRALAMSCNLYFRHIAEELSYDEIVQAARLIGMTPENAMPSPDIDDDSILGNAFAMSPAAMMNVAIAIATRGRRSPGGVGLFGESYRPLYDGLRLCVREGTGKGAWSRRFSVGGKTGTSEVPGRPQLTIGWFIGFAPFHDPRYAVVVMYRRARGMEAATVARQALEEVL